MFADTRKIVDQTIVPLAAAGSYVGPKSGGAVGPILLQSHVVS